MATAKTGSTLKSVLTEASVTINTRGRSVVTGTVVLTNGDIRNFKHDLGPEEIQRFREVIFRSLSHLDIEP